MIRPVNGSGMKRMALLNDLSCFGKAYHLIPAYAVERYSGNAIINEEGRIRKAVVCCIFQKDFLLRCNV